ncbi:unnamed protein product, partial [Musa textilis]
GAYGFWSWGGNGGSVACGSLQIGGYARGRTSLTCKHACICANEDQEKPAWEKTRLKAQLDQFWVVNKYLRRSCWGRHHLISDLREFGSRINLSRWLHVFLWS